MPTFGALPRTFLLNIQEKTFNTIHKMKTFTNSLASRLTALVVAVLGMSATAAAESKVYVEDFSISANEEKEIALNLDTDATDISILEGDIQLPTGLTLVDYGTNQWFKPEDSRWTGMALATYNSSSKHLILAGVGSTVTGTEGAVAKFKVKAAASLGASTTIALSNFKINSTTAITSANATVTRSDAESAGIAMTMSLSETKVQINKGDTKEVQVLMNNPGTSVSGIQATVAVTTGVTIQSITKTDRLSSTLTYNAATGVIMYFGASATGEEGAILTITLKADADYEGDATLTISGINGTTPSSVNLPQEDLTLNISVVDEAAAAELAANKAAFAEYQTAQKAAADELAEDGDSEASQKLITDAKAAIDALTYDEAKTLDQNKAAVDAIVNKLKEDLATQRAADKAAAEAAAAAAAEAAAQAEANAAITALEERIANAVPEEFATDEDVVAAKAAAEAAVEAAKKAVAEAEAVKDNEDVAAAIAAATTAVENLEKAVAYAKAHTEEAIAAEAAAKAAAQEAIDALEKRANEAVPAEVAEEEAVVAAKAEAEAAIEAAKKAVAEAEAVKDNEDVAAAIAAATEAVDKLEKVAAEAKAAYDEAVAKAAAEEAAAKEAALKEIAALAERIENAVPQEVAKYENVVAAKAAAEAAVEAAKKAVDEAEAVKDNEDVAAAIAEATAAVENLEKVAAEALEQYNEGDADLIYDALKYQYFKLRKQFEDLVEYLGEECADVEANYADDLEEIEALLDAANEKLEADYAGGKLTNSSTLLNASKIAALIEKVKEQATAAQKAHDTTTGITAIKAKYGENVEIYTISGKKVMTDQLRKGIYIINGQKVVVK